MLFDLFHTLTALESTWSSGPMIHEILGVSKDDWNWQLLECSRQRLVAKMTDPHEIIRCMAHPIDPSISEALILQATENRSRRFADALVDIPAWAIEVLIALRGAGKKMALISKADVMEAQGWAPSLLADLF